MPRLYSDVEVSAKVVVTDMVFFQEVIRELEQVTDRGDYPAVREYLCEMQHVRDRLANMNIL